MPINDRGRLPEEPAFVVHVRRCCDVGCLPRDVEMVSFVDDFFRAGTRLGDALRPGRPCSCEKQCSRSCEIDCTSAEVERVRLATLAVIALRSPAAASDT